MWCLSVCLIRKQHQNIVQLLFRGEEPRQQVYIRRKMDPLHCLQSSDIVLCVLPLFRLLHPKKTDAQPFFGGAETMRDWQEFAPQLVVECPYRLAGYGNHFRVVASITEH
jgi:hypothetical protein